MNPGVRCYVCIGFIFAGRLRPKSMPGILRKHEILDGVVASQLVVSTAICRPQIDGVKSTNIFVDAKGEANKPSGSGSRIRPLGSVNPAFDGTVGKPGSG